MHTLVTYLMKVATEPVSHKLAELNLTLGQMKLMAVLQYKDSDVTVKDLAEELALSLPAVSRALDPVCRLGYVERQENAQDRRMKDVRISPAGREALAALTAVRLALITEFNDSLSERERERLSSALSPLLARPEIARHDPAQTRGTR